MKIKSVKIINFKFHHELEFELKNKNCLIYGENGTGKSSLYKALYSNLYYFKDKESLSNVRDNYLNRNYPTEELEVNIEFDDTSIPIISRKNDYIENYEILAQKIPKPEGRKRLFDYFENANIYCLNEQVLNSVLEKNLYDGLYELSKHFPIFKSSLNIYNRLITKLKNSEEDIHQLIKEKNSYDEMIFGNVVTMFPISEINTILKYLNADFEISINFKKAQINVDREFTNPIITISIQGNNDLKNHFNEAKLKLISLATYFALIKKSTTNHPLNLLILDDFISSLDMSNRKFIVQYILDYFKNYQIFLFTHNIQFYKLVQKMIDKEIWNIQYIFTMYEKNKLVAKIKDKNENYVDLAQQYIHGDDYNLEIAGNLLRKAFESIIHEFEHLLQIGAVEKLNNILNLLRNKDKVFYAEPQTTINELLKEISTILNSKSDASDKKINLLQNTLSKYIARAIKFQINSYNIIEKTEFYKNILLNPTSHYDMEAELYKSECSRTSDLLKNLNEILESIKKQK